MPDTQLPKICYASDEDGARFAIIDAAEANMAGWCVEAVGDGRVYKDEFVQREAPRHEDGTWYLAYGSGEWRPCWVALGEWGNDELWLVDPQGNRHEMGGFIR